MIAIIGGGLAGLTLSIGLTRHGIKHKIYEAAAEFSEIGAGIAMGPNAISALTLIDQRIRDCYEKCATYNESEDLRDTWVSAVPMLRAGISCKKIRECDTVVNSEHFSPNVDYSLRRYKLTDRS